MNGIEIKAPNVLPPSGVLGFDVAFVAFGGERHSGPLRLRRRTQSHLSSSNGPKNRVSLMFQHNATSVEALQTCSVLHHFLQPPLLLLF